MATPVIRELSVGGGLALDTTTEGVAALALSTETAATLTDLEGRVATLETTGPGGAPDWADVTGTPTTLAGYGITDAATAASVTAEASARAAADAALQTAVDGKAAAAHTHTTAQVTGLDTALAAKATTAAVTAAQTDATQALADAAAAQSTADAAAPIAAVMGVVVHGADAGVARPAGYAAVTWFGSATPTNALANDLHVVTE